MRILISEDDSKSRSMLAYVLKKSGYEVLETANGAEAWEAMQLPGAPRLAILDWMMPVMDGLEVVRRIRAAETERPAYIILLTAKNAKADVIAGLEAGANDYLIKPFDKGELKARVAVGQRMLDLQDALIQSREALARQATRDPLTGMLNRRAILEQLQKELARADRHGDALSIGMCDVDQFKSINDTYGHQTGDDVLRGLAGIFEDSLRKFDHVGRIGGEEFLVITLMKAGSESFSAFERLRKKVAETGIMTRSGKLPVTISIGVAAYISGDTDDELMAAADYALYRAKDMGRDRVVCASRAGQGFPTASCPIHL